jgi:hypothetical protein
MLQLDSEYLEHNSGEGYWKKAGPANRGADATPAAEPRACSPLNGMLQLARSIINGKRLIIWLGLFALNYVPLVSAEE